MEFKLSSGRVYNVLPLTPDQARDIAEANHSLRAPRMHDLSLYISDIAALCVVRSVAVGYALVNAGMGREKAIETLKSMTYEEMEELLRHIAALNEFSTGSGSRYVN